MRKYPAALLPRSFAVVQHPKSHATSEPAGDVDTPVSAAYNGQELFIYLFYHDWIGSAHRTQSAVQMCHVPPDERSIVGSRERALHNVARPASDAHGIDKLRMGIMTIDNKTLPIEQMHDARYVGHSDVTILSDTRESPDLGHVKLCQQSGMTRCAPVAC